MSSYLVGVHISFLDLIFEVEVFLHRVVFLFYYFRSKASLDLLPLVP